MQKLTVKEAIKQGYKYYGIEGWEWQSCKDLNEDVFEEVNEDHHENIRLFEKEAQVTSISEDAIAEIISDHVSVLADEDCYRDDDRILLAIVGLDYSDITNKINNKLAEYKHYMLTDIKIVR